MKLDKIVKRYLIHVHVWNDDDWETNLKAIGEPHCDLENIYDDKHATNYDYPSGVSLLDRCIPNEVYFTEFIPKYFEILPSSLISESLI